MPRWRHISICVTVALLLAYVMVVARSPAVGLGDTANHLVRAYIMADLIFHHGMRFGSQFYYHFLALPYVLLDLLIAATVEILGPRVAVATWTLVTFLSVPAALLLYFRAVVGIGRRALPENEVALFLVLCATYLTSDFFFVVGFFAFKLGLACVIVLFALLELLRYRWSDGLYVLYYAILFAAYLIHLSTVVFMAAIVGVSAVLQLWFHSFSLRRELLLVAPIVTVLVWHFGVAVHYGPPTDLASASYWGTLLGKALWLARNYHRYGGRVDAFLLFLYAASLLALIRTRHWRGAFTSPRVVESLALAATFFAMYFALPFSLGDATYLDIRALAPAALFMLLACIHLPRAEPLSNSAWRSPWLAVVLAIVLSAVNLAYLGRHFEKLSAWSMKVRALFADIPVGAHVLPVETRPDIWPYVDPASMAVVDRHAFIPYIFSASTDAPQVYFGYRDYPYAPPDNWYARGSSSSVHWREIACSYQEILVTLPFDPHRIRIATSPVAETSSAQVLAIDPRACEDTVLGAAHDKNIEAARH